MLCRLELVTWTTSNYDMSILLLHTGAIVLNVLLSLIPLTPTPKEWN